MSAPHLKTLFASCLQTRACWVLPVALWAVVVGLSLLQSIADIQRHSMDIATAGARNMFRMVEMTRLWNARHGGIYAPLSEGLQPNPYLKVPNRDLETTGGLKLTMINPAYMTRQIADIAGQHGVLFHITSLKPLRPANAPDPWERQSLQRFEQGEKEYRELVESADPPMFRYMAPLKVKKACMKCHEQQGYEIGDIRGGISVSMSADAVFGQNPQRVQAAVLKHLLVFALVTTLALLFLAHTRRRVLQLESVRARQAAVIEERTAHLRETNERLREENTERRRVEEKYRSVSQAAHDAIISAEESGNVGSWNMGAERIFGYSAEEIVGQPLTRLLPENRLSAQVQAFDEATGSEKPAIQGRTMELIGLRKDGTEFPVELTLGSWEHAGRRHYTAVIRDITDRKQSEQSRRLASAVFSSAAEGLIITDREQNIVSVNPAFHEITGYSAEEALGKSPAILSSGRHDASFYQHMWQSLEQTGQWKGEIWNRRKSGELYPEWLSLSVVRDPQGQIIHYVGAFFDISEIKTSQAQLDFLAHHDPLTNLPNRRLFMERLDHALEQSSRRETRLAVLFIDLDRFKMVNDSLGHQVGDELLVQVSRRLTGCLRGADTVARLGGDEFTVLLENLPSSDDILPVVQKIVETFKPSFNILGHTLFVTPSIGISRYPEDGKSAGALLKGADSAMYKAKEHGRNCYQYYSEELTELAMERLQLETQLHQALNEGQLRVYYQPQIEIRTNSIVGAEALLRWEHPELGLVSPEKFIPLAESNGQIIEIGEWVLRQACEQAVLWRDGGAGFCDIAVNISGKQIENKGFLEMVAQVIGETGIEPRHLELEITESRIMRRAEQTMELLKHLRELGVRIAIDDFGTGYSSLSYLKRLPIDTLKIDRSFIRDLPGDVNDAAITRAVIALGHSLHLSVIAEGVETLEQRRLLESEGCELAQGYHYSRPVPAEDLVALSPVTGTHSSP
jgi:diguanylate cyclase (GGDEF)-like protein/PAS domain S-box-containing protein